MIGGQRFNTPGLTKTGLRRTQSSKRKHSHSRGLRIEKTYGRQDLKTGRCRKEGSNEQNTGATEDKILDRGDSISRTLRKTRTKSK